MIEPERDMEIDLLSWAQTIRSARVQELARTGILGVIANIFHEQARLLGYFLLDHKGSFRNAFGCQVRGAEEFSQHAAHPPTIVQFPRPWQLQIGLRAATRYIDRPGRERHAEHHG